MMPREVPAAVARPLSTSTDYWIDCTTCGNDPEARKSCFRCDGRGVLVSDEERRAADRPAGDPVWTELARSDARAMNLVTASRDEWKATAERLLAENKRLREVIHRAANAIVKRMRGPSPLKRSLDADQAAELPSMNDRTGDGLHQQETQ